MAASYLRRLALTVREPAPGQFVWAILESTGDAIVFDEEVAAGKPVATYGQALRNGVEALARIPEGSSQGPRRAGEDEQADPVVESSVG